MAVQKSVKIRDKALLDVRNIYIYKKNELTFSSSVLAVTVRHKYGEAVMVGERDGDKLTAEVRKSKVL